MVRYELLDPKTKWLLILTTACKRKTFQHIAAFALYQDCRLPSADCKVPMVLFSILA